MASYVEDRIQRSFYMVRMSAPPPAPLEGTPEAIGKADYLETVIQDITSMLGITSGLWQARVLERRPLAGSEAHCHGNCNTILGPNTEPRPAQRLSREAGILSTCTYSECQPAYLPEKEHPKVIWLLQFMLLSCQRANQPLPASAEAAVHTRALRLLHLLNDCGL